MKNRLIHIFVLSCRRATLLIEKSQSKKLGPIQRMQLSFHLKLCDGCLQYQEQSKFIEDLLQKDHDTLSKLSGMKLSDKSKELIQKAINEKFKKK